MDWTNLAVTAGAGTVVSTVIAAAGRVVWRRVLVPVGDAARSVAHLVDAIADASLVPEMNTYLHDRMHLLINELTAVKAGVATTVHMLEPLRAMPELLDQVAEDITAVRESLAPPPPGG